MTDEMTSWWIDQAPGPIFTKLHFLWNLRMSPIS